MSVDERAAAPATYDEWRLRRWRLTSLLLAVLWLACAAAMVLVGERRSDLDSLTSALRSGEVAQVEVVGLPHDPDWRGRTTLTLRWQGRVLQRYADVSLDRRRHASGDAVVGASIVGDPVTYLQSLGESVEVTRSDRTTGTRTDWRGWRGPGWLGLLGIVALFATFLLATSGPEPWRATRWAWGWLVLLGGPLGALGYLLLGGPLGVLRPRDLSRRLAGFWGFVLAVALAGSS